MSKESALFTENTVIIGNNFSNTQYFQIWKIHLFPCFLLIEMSCDSKFILFVNNLSISLVVMAKSITCLILFQIKKIQALKK